MRVTSHERVVAIVVCHNGRPFIRDTLRGLTRQTRPIDDLIVVDTGSRDGTKDWVREHIGAESVFSVRGQFGHAVTAALRHPRLAGADWVWLLHDDSCPELDALQLMLREAEYRPDAAVLGPKLVGWDDVEELREVGWWIDRAAYSVSPIDGDEIDQGQHDNIGEAFYVSTAAMLVRPEALQAAGGFDLRMSAFRDDLDLCWRVRLLGGKVLVVPAARVRHFAATTVGSRISPATGLRRYLIERHSLNALMKGTALRRVPMALLAYFLATLVRLLGLLSTGRFGEAGQVLLAWGWNAKELPVTLKLRRRIQASRTVPDAELAKLRVPHPGGQRLRSVVRALSELATATEAGGTHASSLGPKEIVRRLITRHPVATMVALFAVVMAVSLRSELVAARIGGGNLAAFPASATDALSGFVSAVGTDGLGSTLPASPALAVFGAASVLTFGKGLIAQKLLLWLVLPLAAATCTRALRMVVPDLRARALAGLLYATSPLAIGALAQGRVGELAFLVLAPSILAQSWQALRLVQPREAWRPVLRFALLSALTIAIYPTALLILAGVVVVAAGAGIATAPAGRRGDVGRRAALLAGGLPTALVLLLPWSLVLFTSASPLRGVGAALVSPTFADLVQLQPGGPGAPWWIGPVYPLLTLVSVLLAGSLRRLLAFWCALALVGMALLAYWQTLALPPHFTDWPGGVLIPGAVAWAAVVGIGLSSALPALRRSKGAVAAAAQPTGRRAQRSATRVSNVTPVERVGAAGLVVVTAVTGVVLAGVLGAGSWPLETGENPLPATVTASDRRVLWLDGHPDGGVRYAVTGPEGQTLLEWARQAPAGARASLGDIVGDVVGARTHHAGELLRAFNIGWVVVREGPQAERLARLVARQGDLASRVTSQAALFEGPAPAPAGMHLAEAPPTVADLLTAPAGPSALHGDLPGVAGTVQGPGAVVLPMPTDDAWQASAGGQRLEPVTAFGWAQAFTLPEGVSGDLVVAYGGQRNRDLALIAELILVLAMLATLARPTSRPAPLVPVSDEDTGELRLPAAVVGSYQ